MSISIADLIHFERFSSFRLIAGRNGLKNIISKVGFLDHEFTVEGETKWAKGQFIIGEFLMTSLLYAKDDESLILDAIKRLSKVNVSGLAIKNIFSLNISQEVIRYADNNSFPLFVFTDFNVFFEDIIIDLTNAINLDSSNNLIEKKVNSILYDDLNRETIKKLSLEINHFFKNCNYSIYFRNKETMDAIQSINMIRVLNNNSPNDHSLFLKFENGFFYINTADDLESTDLEHFAADILKKINLNIDTYNVGISNIHKSLSQIKNALQESIFASQTSMISESNINFYKDIGIYKFILPLIDEPCIIDFSTQIINAIKNCESSSNSEIFDTVIQYVECEGNIKSTAQKLFQHENTIRYRINKISKLLNLNMHKRNFYEELAIAVKIFKINQILNKSTIE